MRTAKEWGVRPLAILRGHPDTEWTRLDAILATASTYATDLTCSGCGQPKHEAWNPDSEGWYETRDAECNGCAALERDANAHKDDDFRADRKVYVVDTRPPEVHLRPWNPEP